MMCVYIYIYIYIYTYVYIYIYIYMYVLPSSLGPPKRRVRKKVALSFPPVSPSIRKRPSRMRRADEKL